MNTFERLNVRTEIEAIARDATPATPNINSSKNSVSSRRLTENSIIQPLIESLSDDNLALAVTAWLSPYVAASEVGRAWESLTDLEKISLSEREFQALKGLKSDTIPELIHWRDAWIKAICAAKIGRIR